MIKILKKFNEIFSRIPSFETIRTEHFFDDQLPDIIVRFKTNSIHFQYVFDGNLEEWTSNYSPNTTRGKKFVEYYQKLLPELNIWATREPVKVHNYFGISYFLICTLTINNKSFFATYEPNELPRSRGVNPF